MRVIFIGFIPKDQRKQCCTVTRALDWWKASLPTHTLADTQAAWARVLDEETAAEGTRPAVTRGYRRQGPTAGDAPAAGLRGWGGTDQKENLQRPSDSTDGGRSTAPLVTGHLGTFSERTHPK